MLTSPRANASENFLPSHHLALITQPVLAARSRSRRKTTTTTTSTNILAETSNKDKFDSMTNSRRNSFNDSPPLILPINRVKFHGEKLDFLSVRLFRLTHHNIKRNRIIIMIHRILVSIRHFQRIHLYKLNNIRINTFKFIVL